MRTWGRGIVVVGWIVLTGLVVWRIVGLYQGPWEGFADRAHEFLTVATLQDSAHLSDFGASPTAIHQVLEMARQHPGKVGVTGRLEVIGGHRDGDTARVAFVYPGCSDNLLTVKFRGTGWKAKIEEVSLPCDVR